MKKEFNKKVKASYIYMMTTHDELQLPIAVADTIKELEQLTGVRYNTIMTSISQGRPYYYRIPIED